MAQQSPFAANAAINPSSAKLPLEDVQGKADTRGVALQCAGVSKVDMPLQILQKNGTTQTVAATVSMSVGLPETQKGTHMSRFIIQLAEWSSKGKIISIYLQEFLKECNERLNATTCTTEIKFKYFLNKKAPVTEGSAPMAYDVTFRGRLTAQKETELFVTVEMPIATLCPCSKSISDFGAHNQRAITSVTLKLKPCDESHPMVWIENLVQLVDDEASCPVFPLLKRDDEKWVTERQYTNAKFVEDVVRDVTLALRQQSAVEGFSVKVEALESIHGHNAWAAHTEGLDVVFF